MKKLFLLAGLVFFFSYTSCVGTEDYEDDEMVYGFYIYNTADMENTLALDPALIAFKLNMLVETAGGTDISNVIVDKDPDDDDDKGTNLKEYLFGASANNKLSYDAGSTTWTITYGSSSAPVLDKVRKGNIYIDTKGVSLGSLASGQSWEIKTETEYTYQGTGEWTAKYYSYKITPNSNRSWKITGANNAGGDVNKDWNFTFEITQSKVAEVYDDMKDVSFEMTGGAKGTPRSWGHEFIYKIRDGAPLRFSSLAGEHALSKLNGVEDIEINAPESATGFPSNKASCRWEKTSSDYSVAYTLSYNGYTRTVTLSNSDD